MEELQNRTQADYKSKLEASKTEQRELLEQVNNHWINILILCLIDYKFGE